MNGMSFLVTPASNTPTMAGCVSRARARASAYNHRRTDPSNELDRDVAPQDFVPALPHLCHAARAEQARQAVALVDQVSGPEMLVSRPQKYITNPMQRQSKLPWLGFSRRPAR
jgi:hypothetical protein